MTESIEAYLENRKNYMNIINDFYDQVFYQELKRRGY